MKTPVQNVVSDAQMNGLSSIISERYITEKGREHKRPVNFWEVFALTLVR